MSRTRVSTVLFCLSLMLSESSGQPSKLANQVPNKSRHATAPSGRLAVASPNHRNRHYEVLDSEDLSLLEKFYRETRQQDPYQSDKLTSEGLWNGARDQELADALTDALAGSAQQPKTSADPATRTRPASASDWTIDPALVDQGNRLTTAQTRGSKPRVLASYAPSVRLLTAYDPIEKAVREVGETNQVRGLRANRVVGATLVGNNELTRPNISSTSPSEAIKMHDELLEEAPKDGKVRVRMYFHRAIHDDPKLYGTGPWKYWGHGWGVEFKYDPKQKANADGKPADYNEKGYTIERAFGRDFCRDKNNCRPPDDDKFY